MVTFKKVMRECPYNEKRGFLYEKRGFLYDYEILEDGTKKGIFRARGYRRGYELCDISNRNVRHPERKHIIGADTKADFAQRYQDFKHLIPTTGQIAERTRIEAEKAAENERQKAEAHALWLKQQAAPEMYEALKALTDYIDREGPPAKEWKAITEWSEKGQAAIAKAEGK